MQIAFVKHVGSGRMLPLQLVKNVYGIEGELATPHNLGESYVSHWETCPNVADAKADAARALEDECKRADPDS